MQSSLLVTRSPTRSPVRKSRRLARRISGNSPSPLFQTVVTEKKRLPKELRDLVAPSGVGGRPVHHGMGFDHGDDISFICSNSDDCDVDDISVVSNLRPEAALGYEGHDLFPTQCFFEEVALNSCCRHCVEAHGKVVPLIFSRKQLGLATYIECRCDARSVLGPKATVHRFFCNSKCRSSHSELRADSFSAYDLNVLWMCGLQAIGRGYSDQETLLGFLDLRDTNTHWRTWKNLEEELADCEIEVTVEIFHENLREEATCVKETETNDEGREMTLIDGTVDAQWQHRGYNSPSAIMHFIGAQHPCRPKSPNEMLW